MTKKNDVDPLLVIAAKYLDGESLNLIQKAYHVAQQAHAGQLRQSNKPYITHPLAVASLLAEMEQELETVIGGLLHDVVEDTPVTLDEINATFGSTVAQLVDGVTKLNKMQFHSRQEAQIENYRRLFLAMAKDFRVIIIKLADRLHNMRTLEFLRPEKQKRIAKETLDIYAPLAHRLGIYNMKWQLEDLSFRYLHPEQFEEIKDMLEQTRYEREESVTKVVTFIKKMLSNQNINNTQVYGRPKHLYSIFQKIDKKNKNIDELYDLIGVRIIVEKVEQCYAVLGFIHTNFHPISERFKDYIALAKPNGYQSLHSTVLTKEGRPIEIQIRTKDMHHMSEFGFAAHWQYKQKNKKEDIQGKLKWLQSLIEHQNEAVTPNDYMQTIKMDLFTEEVFVFTPRGDLKVLSMGSTALDFAYSIHTEVGNQCKGVLVNGKIVPFGYTLQNGDQVEVLRSKQVKPKVDWLQLVNSRHSRYKIKQFLNSQKRQDLVVDGKSRLKRAFFAEGLIFETCINDIGEQIIKDRFHLSKIEDIYLFVEQGDLSTKEIVRYVIKQLEKQQEPTLNIKKYPQKRPSSTTGIYIMGEKNMKYTLAKCCLPIPGDDIVGIVVPAKGVSIHRHDCLNLSETKKKSPKRILEVEWDKDVTNKLTYLCTLQIKGYDRKGLLQDLLGIIYETNLNLREVKTKVNKDNTRMSAIISVDIANIKQYYDLKNKLTRIEDVFSVSRMSLGLEK